MFIYPWEAACLKAVLETDDSLMLSRITVARAIIADRLDEIELISDEEQYEIEVALTSLKTLETERCSKH
jgi:hypothetical protein